MSDFVVYFALPVAYFTLSVLAVYRVSYMIANEDGPLDVFVFIREKAGQKNWIGRGLNCVLCISVWISIIPAVTMTRNIGLFQPTFETFILYWFAIAGGVLIIHKYFAKR